MSYAAIVKSKRVASQGTVYTKTGERFWIVKGEWGPSSHQCLTHPGVPSDVMTWETEEEAEAFAKGWGGHPWWCKPNGKFEIVKVRPKYKTIKDGYELAEGEPAGQVEQTAMAICITAVGERNCSCLTSGTFRCHDDKPGDYARAAIGAQAADMAGLVDALKHTTASLVAAVSLLEHGGRKAAPSDKMFEQMLVDYKAAIEHARQVLSK